MASVQALPLLTFSQLPHSRQEVRLHQSTLSVLESNFHPQADLLILVAAGLAGVGKRTWLNTLALSFDSDLHSDPFPGASLEKGLRVYPRPLKLDWDQQVQVMLCELESPSEAGNEGCKDLLRKLVFSGLALASRFCIHADPSQWRTQLELIREVYEQTSELPKERPSIAILLTNTGFVASAEELKSLIRSNCSLSEETASSLQIYPRGLPPAHFLKSHQSKDLFGSAYHENSLRFLANSLEFSKKRPGFDSKLKFAELPTLLNHLESALNEDDYRHTYTLTIKQNVDEVIQTTVKRHQTVYETQRNTGRGGQGYEEKRQFCAQAAEQAWTLILGELQESGLGDLSSLEDLHVDLQAFRERMNSCMMQGLEEGREEAKEKSPLKQATSLVSNQTIRERLADLESTKEAQLQPPPFLGRLKKDGTPDMRFKANRDMLSLQTSPTMSSNSLSSKSKPKSSK